jgi:hypothetical protein
MPDERTLQGKTVESIYSLAAADRLDWKKKSNDSYSSSVGSTRFDIDKGASGDEVFYVLWIFENGNLASRIDGTSLRASRPGGSDDTYQGLMKKIFALAQTHVRSTSLERALQELEQFRTKNTQDDADDDL